MEIQINTSSRQPIYRQVGEQIRLGIARGRLKADDRLPSVRELSKRLVVNPNTIARAYTELERDGVLNSRQGLGVFVAAPNADLTKKARNRRLMELLDQLLTEAVHLGFDSDEVVGLVTERVGKYQWSPAGSKAS